MNGLQATFRGACAQAWANRRGFWFEITVMILNDLVWVVFWVLFFHRVGTVRGWNTNRILMLQAILTTGGGIVLGVFANARNIGRLAADGELDAALALPVPTLAYILVRKIQALNLGDTIFGVVLFVAIGHPSPSRVAMFLGGSAIAATVLTGFLVLIGSSSFFVGRNEGSELGFHAIVMFGSYPIDVFTGAGRAMLYSVVPAAFIAAVPARLVDSFDPGLAAGAAAAAVVFATLGVVAFNLGLRRYTSGNVWKL